MTTVTSDGDSRFAFATRRDVLGDREPDVDDVGGLRAGGQLLHVEDGRRVEHRAARRHREHREGVAHAERREPGAVDRVDRDVALGAVAVADVLAVEEHRRLVLLALADDHDAVHGHGADQLAHRVDGGAVRAVLVAPADPAAGGHRGGLGDAHQLQGEVAVRRLDRRRQRRGDARRPRVSRSSVRAPSSACALLLASLATTAGRTGHPQVRAPGRLPRPAGAAVGSAL